MVIVVPSGQSAVLWQRFGGGTVLDPRRLMGEGIHFVLPWDEAFLYDRRLQSFSDTFTSISKDGVNIKVSMNVRFRLNPEAIPALHEAIGPDYLHQLLIPEIGNRMREIIAGYTAEQVYSLERPRIQAEVLERTQARLSEEAHLGDGRLSYVTLYDTLLLNIELPSAVVSAIDTKLNEFYASEAYDFRVQRERKETERKRIEAQGIHDFQTIVSGGITDSYLRLRGIEATVQLAQSVNSKVVIVGGGKDGIPVILNNVEAPAQPAASTTTAPAAAAVTSQVPTASTPTSTSTVTTPPVGHDSIETQTPVKPAAQSADGWTRYLPAMLFTRLKPVIEWLDGALKVASQGNSAQP
jgi:regulator of protease activity HflC (stomatin/prohibitin superfamily)